MFKVELSVFVGIFRSKGYVPVDGDSNFSLLSAVTVLQVIPKRKLGEY